MRFDLTAEQEAVREAARRFFENETPIGFIRKQFDLPQGFSPAWWKQISGLGFTSIGVPEEAGGYPLTGAAGQDLAVVAEEMGRSVGPGPFLPTAVSLAALSAANDGADRGAVMGQIMAGEVIAAWAYGEPGNRWEPDAFQTTAEEAGETVLLQGGKAYVEAGAEAQLLLVTARSGSGLTQLLVPAETAGVTVIAGRSIDFVRRFAEIRFDGARLPRTAVVGRFGAAAAAVERQYQLALLLQCAETNGAVERALEFTIDYMRERYAFGRSIASYQALKHRLADNLLKLQSCMATTDAGLSAFDSGSPEASRLARIAKTYAGAKSSAIVSDLVQMTGGIALTWDHDLHLYERRIAVNRAVYGTPEHHRASVYRLLNV